MNALHQVQIGAPSGHPPKRRWHTRASQHTDRGRPYSSRETAKLIVCSLMGILNPWFATRKTIAIEGWISRLPTSVPYLRGSVAMARHEGVGQIRKALPLFWASMGRLVEPHRYRGLQRTYLPYLPRSRPGEQRGKTMQHEPMTRTMRPRRKSGGWCVNKSGLTRYLSFAESTTIPFVC